MDRPQHERAIPLPPRRLVQIALSSAVLRDVVALYGLQVAKYLVPLATVPYLARVLGPAELGLVALALALASYITVIIDFGFALSGSREVARYRHDRGRISEILAGVLGAKISLSLLGTVIAVGALFALPVLRERPVYVLCALAWALAQGFSMAWFFQGMERIRTAAAYEFAAKAVGSGMIFVLVRNPSQGWYVLALQAAASFVGNAILLARGYRLVAFRVPNLALVKEAVREGWPMFLFRSSLTFFAGGNSMILGFFAPTVAIGYYAGAERIHKIFQSFTVPVEQSVYPRLTHSIAHSQDDAISLARKTAITLLVLGIGSGLVTFILAPLLIRVVLGPGFEPAIPVLRVFAISLPIIAVSNALGGQWMLPLRLDKSFTRLVVSAGVLNVLIASALARALAAKGMAISVTACEIFLCLSIYLTLRRRGLDPLFEREALRQRLNDSMGLHVGKEAV